TRGDRPGEDLPALERLQDPGVQAERRPGTGGDPQPITSGDHGLPRSRVVSRAVKIPVRADTSGRPSRRPGRWASWRHRAAAERPRPSRQLRPPVRYRLSMYWPSRSTDDPCPPYPRSSNCVENRVAVEQVELFVAQRRLD